MITHTSSAPLIMCVLIDISIDSRSIHSLVSFNCSILDCLSDQFSLSTLPHSPVRPKLAQGGLCDWYCFMHATESPPLAHLRLKLELNLIIVIVTDSLIAIAIATVIATANAIPIIIIREFI